MSSWNEVVHKIQDAPSVIDDARATAIGALTDYRKRNVVCYYSGWLQNGGSVSVSITDDDMNGLMNAVYKMDRARGLDLVLHTPGGDLAATEAVVKYLRDCFGNDICAIVPQMAMSAGTMIACSCHEVIMGRQSSLGPTDPQLGGVAAGGVVEEFEQAVKDVTANPASAALWGQIIGKYHPTFLGDCKRAMRMSRGMVGGWLLDNMLAGVDDASDRVEKILDLLCDHETSAMHNRHFSHADLENAGMKISLMEEDNELQDRILTLHHAFMVTFQRSSASKIIESSTGARWIISGSSSS